MQLKSVGIFVAGLSIGFIGGVVATKNYFAQRAEEDIESVKEVYKEDLERVKSEMAENFNEVVDSVEPNKVSEMEKNDIPTQGYVDYSAIIKKMNNGEFEGEKPEEKVSVSVHPYTISDEEFIEMNNYNKETYTYIKEDDVFLNMNYSLVQGGHDVIGVDNLDQFGVYEDGTLFVRNDEERTDYEVLLVEGKTVDEYLDEEA